MPVTVHKARGRFKPLPMRLVITPKPPDIAERARDVGATTPARINTTSTRAP